MTCSPATFRRRVHAGAALATALVTFAACGLPAEERVTTFNPGDLPDPLTNTTTTTSTTTTTVAPSTVPPSTDPGETTTTSTTTVAPFAGAETDIFYTIGITDDVQRFIRELPRPVPVELVINQLVEPPPELAGFNLRTAVRPGLIAGVDVERGIATVELSQDVLDRMTSAAQRRAIAQIVLTLTSFVTSNQGAIGGVRFIVDDEPISVFLPAQNGNSEPGEIVAFDDFVVLVVDAQFTSATTTTSTTSTTVATTTTSP